MTETYRDCYFRKKSILLTRSPGLLGDDDHIINNVESVWVESIPDGKFTFRVAYRDGDIYRLVMLTVKRKLYFSKGTQDYKILKKGA